MLILLLSACESDKLPRLVDTGAAAETAAEVEGEPDLWEARCESARAALEATLSDAGAPGGAVAVWAEGELRCAFGVGVRGPYDPLPVDSHTLFRVGEITETMTDIALLQKALLLPDQLDTPVTDLIADLQFTRDEDWADQITVRHALQQTTAMVDVEEVAANPDDEALARYLLDVYPATRWLMATPGELWNPSTPGDALAGLLVEFLSGVRYRQSIRLQLFSQLEMKDSFFVAEDVLAHGNSASALTKDWSGESDATRLADAEAYDNGWARPSAYAWSAAGDMGKLLGFLIEGDALVLSDEDRARMWTETVPCQLCSGRVAFGYGLFVEDGAALDGRWFGGLTLARRGDLPGFSAELRARPEDGVGVVVLASGDALDLESTLAAALTAFGVEGLALGPLGSSETGTLDGLSGTYVDPWTLGSIDIMVDDDQLRISLPLLDGYGVAYEPLLSPVCPDSFTLSIEDEPRLISFLRPEAGADATRIRARGFVADRSL